MEQLVPGILRRTFLKPVQPNPSQSEFGSLLNRQNADDGYILHQPYVFAGGLCELIV